MGTHKPMGCASSVTSVTSTSSPKFMNSAQYSVMAERSSRRRCHKRTTLHNHRVCVLMDATEGNNLKYSNPCTSRGSSEVEEAKNLPSSVMKPFRSWMANARRRIRDHSTSYAQTQGDSSSSSSDTSSDMTVDMRVAKRVHPQICVSRSFCVTPPAPACTLRCRSVSCSHLSCSGSVYSTIRSREHSLLPVAVPSDPEI